MTSETGNEAPPPPPAQAAERSTLVPADPPAADAPMVLSALEATLAKVETAAHLADPVAMVHDARKAMKEYRGLLRLVPGDAAKAARRETAAAARALSAARDRAAALEALEALGKAGLLAPADVVAASAAIGTDPAAKQEAESHRAELAAFLDAARTRLTLGLAESAASADLVKGMTRAYRAARRAHFSTPEAMHEARKRVVTHRYQMSFFASTFAGRGTKRAGRAQSLRDLLGNHQDIEALRPMVEAHREELGAAMTDRLLKAMATRQKRLKREAVALHRKLFRRRPKAFAHRFGKALDA